MATGLSGVTLYGNNEIVVYMPNSLTYDIGNAESTVSPQVVGNGAVSNIVTQDFSTQKSSLKFDLKTTSENEEVVIGWIEAADANVFKIISAEGKTRVFENAVIVNKPEFDTSADGVISVELESAPAVVA